MLPEKGPEWVNTGKIENNVPELFDAVIYDNGWRLEFKPDILEQISWEDRITEILDKDIHTEEIVTMYAIAHLIFYYNLTVLL